MEGALGQRDKQKPGKGRQQTELGSEPGMGDGRVCKAAWETSKCKVTRTRSIKKKKTLHKDVMGSRGLWGPGGTQDRLVAE